MGDFSVHRNTIHQSPGKDGEETHRNSDLDPNVAKINRLPQGNSSLGRNTGFPHQNKNPRLPFAPHNVHCLPDSKNHRKQGPRTRKTRGSTSRPGRALVTGVASWSRTHFFNSAFPHTHTGTKTQDQAGKEK